MKYWIVSGSPKHKNYTSPSQTPNFLLPMHTKSLVWNLKIFKVVFGFPVICGQSLPQQAVSSSCCNNEVLTSGGSGSHPCELIRRKAFASLSGNLYPVGARMPPSPFWFCVSGVSSLQKSILRYWVPNGSWVLFFLPFGRKCFSTLLKKIFLLSPIRFLQQEVDGLKLQENWK